MLQPFSIRQKAITMCAGIPSAGLDQALRLSNSGIDALRTKGVLLEPSDQCALRCARRVAANIK
jgi:hypothetical protein